MQEFRIQTSTYAPEFGRTAGRHKFLLSRAPARINFMARRSTICETTLSMRTIGSTVSRIILPLPKAKERQNDFGGTFSGPILKDKTFFFFSYEGLRLRLPQTTLTFVPDTNPPGPLFEAICGTCASALHERVPATQRSRGSSERQSSRHSAVQRQLLRSGHAQCLQPSNRSQNKR